MASPVMNQPRIIVFGDSHIDAVRRAGKLRLMARKPLAVEAYRLPKMTRSDNSADSTPFEDVMSIVRNLSSQDMVFSMIGGNQHAVLATIQHPLPFDFFGLEDGDIINEEIEIIPRNVVRAFLKSGIMAGDGERLKILREATAARVFHIIPPPPKESAEHILRCHETHFASLGREFAAQARERGHPGNPGIGRRIASWWRHLLGIRQENPHGISAASLRRKAWQLQVEILEDICKSINIEPIDPPSRAVTANGFLDPLYYAQDVTHANSDYGELILQTIDEAAAELCHAGDH